MKDVSEELTALIAHQRRHRGNDGLLLSTLESILALCEKLVIRAGGRQTDLEAMATCVCSCGVIDLLTAALVQCEEYPSMHLGEDIAKLCADIAALIVDTEAGAQAVSNSDLTRSSVVRWMVIRKMGERYFGPGLCERMEKYIPSDEEFQRLCPR